jgi:hypothetical protein
MYHHQDDTTWREDYNEQILTSTLPKGFYKVMAEHYAARLQQVIHRGRQYSKEYFFVRDSHNYYKKQR